MENFKINNNRILSAETAYEMAIFEDYRRKAFLEVDGHYEWRFRQVRDNKDFLSRLLSTYFEMQFQGAKFWLVFDGHAHLIPDDGKTLNSFTEAVFKAYGFKSNVRLTVNYLINNSFAKERKYAGIHLPMNTPHVLAGFMKQYFEISDEDDMIFKKWLSMVAKKQVGNTQYAGGEPWLTPIFIPEDTKTAERLHEMAVGLTGVFDNGIVLDDTKEFFDKKSRDKLLSEFEGIWIEKPYVESERRQKTSESLREALESDTYSYRAVRSRESSALRRTNLIAATGIVGGNYDDDSVFTPIHVRNVTTTTDANWKRMKDYDFRMLVGDAERLPI